MLKFEHNMDEDGDCMCTKFEGAQSRDRFFRARKLVKNGQFWPIYIWVATDMKKSWWFLNALLTTLILFIYSVLDTIFLFFFLYTFFLLFLSTVLFNLKTQINHTVNYK